MDADLLEAVTDLDRCCYAKRESGWLSLHYGTKRWVVRDTDLEEEALLQNVGRLGSAKCFCKENPVESYRIAMILCSLVRQVRLP